MFWFIIALLSAVFIALLMLPLIRRQGAVGTEAGARAALDARLAAIERDREAGLLGSEEAEEARLEAKRAALEGKKDETGEKPARAGRFAAFAFAGAAPLAALWIYVSIGAPGLVGVKPGEGGPPMAGTMSGAAGPMTQADVAAAEDLADSVEREDGSGVAGHGAVPLICSPCRRGIEAQRRCV